jgi:hypothetical protein
MGLNSMLVKSKRPALQKRLQEGCFLPSTRAFNKLLEGMPIPQADPSAKGRNKIPIQIHV